MERPFWRDPRTWILVGVTLVTLWAGWLLKAQCIDLAWGGGREYQHYCYTDVQALYGARIEGGQIPYVQQFNEYPPLTGLLMYSIGQLTSSLAGFFALNSMVMAVLAVATTLMLAKMLGPERRVLWWALAPSLAFYAFYNWDLLAVFFAVAGLWAYRKDHFLTAGILLGLGACAKIYPAFMMPGLGMAMVARFGGLERRGWRFGLGFVAAMVVVAVPLAFLNLNGFLESYAFQLGRGSNFETVWYMLGHLGREFHIGWLAVLGENTGASIGSGLIMLASFTAAAMLAQKGRLGAMEAAALPVLAFLAFNKVLSIQYVLWALPFLVLIEMPTVQRAAVLMTDFFVWITLFTFFFVQEISGPLAGLFAPVVAGVLLRSAAYAWIAWWLVKSGWDKGASSPISSTTTVQA